jgi:hypothetical protein
VAWGIASSSHVAMGDLGRGCCAGRIDVGQHEILAIGSRSLSICRRSTQDFMACLIRVH